MINDQRIARRVWKTQIYMRVTFISSKDTGEIMWGSNTDNIIRDIFKSFLHNYQEELKIISRSEFIFESVELMDYKLHRVRFRRGGSYIKSSEWFLKGQQ